MVPNGGRRVVPVETVDILGAAAPHPGEWQPVMGSEALRIVRDTDAVPISSRETVEREAVQVLARCQPPTGTDPASRTGVVIGYVQSGKTLSFTVVTALARDNGFRLIVVLTGISRPLFRQSTERLIRDLDLIGFSRPWKHFTSDRFDRADQRSLEAALRRWEDPSVANPEDKQTVLVTVMKQKDHLERVTGLLNRVRLGPIPALIIDDEADQAGLNISSQPNRPSATYSRIAALRSAIPRHTFLQYTATPQALLLINLIDTLSPEFAELLTPGEEYAGGHVFFEGDPKFTPIIPFSDVPTRNNRLLEPPRSLKDALRTFLVGVAATGGREQRTMMVHPSRETSQHREFLHWVTQTMLRWEHELTALRPGDVARRECIERFRAAYDELSSTAPTLPPFDDLVGVLPRILRETVPFEMNRRPRAGIGQAVDPTPNWDRDYAHIVVGGDLLNRGVTLPGLAVTYMPRGRGVGNADTIQQRARWFGYKANYIGFCRVYLTADTLTDYRHYVEHERSVRQQLAEHRSSGRSLKEWRRAFLLDPDLRPTRAEVLRATPTPARGAYRARWYRPGYPHQADLEAHRRIADALLGSYEFSVDSRFRRHRTAEGVSLDEVVKRFLVELQYRNPHDSASYTGVLLQLRWYLEQRPEAVCKIVYMRPQAGPEESRRLLQASGQVNPFAGRSGAYPGDQAVHGDSVVTIQVHLFNDIRARDGSIAATDVPVLPIWVPADACTGWLVELRGGNAR